MASPVGHTLSGLALWTLWRRRGNDPASFSALLGVALLANVPDIDFLPGLWFGEAGSWHHGPTHGLFFALIVSVCIYVLAVLMKRGQVAARRWAGLGLGIIGMHLVLDYFTLDTTPPLGLQLFSPLTEDYYTSPWPFLRSVYRGSWSLENLDYWIRLGAEEGVQFGALLVGAWWWRWRRNHERAS